MKQMPANVFVSGDGPAACATVLALRRLGIDVTISPRDSTAASSPPVVLGESTVALMADLCGDSSIFEHAHQLRRRIVCWGADPPQAVAHAAISIRGTILRRALFDTVAAKLDGADSDFLSWHVYSSPADLPRESICLRIGKRVTLSCAVGLTSRADSGACWIESTPDGWVFLAPLSDQCAALQVTIPIPPRSAPEALAEMVARTRYISQLVASVASDVDVYATSPSINSPCGSRGWLSVGAAAMTLDPLCGDGTGHSFRSGLLAAGVIRAVADGQPREAILNHFNERLRVTFAAHLMACKRFYAPANFGKAWAEEIEAIQTGANCMSSLPEASLPFHFQNLHLIPVTDAHDQGGGPPSESSRSW